VGFSGDLEEHPYLKGVEVMTDAKSPEKIDMEQALWDPGSVFATPEALLLHDDLSDQQKIEVLRRWAYDRSEISVAVEEGMPDGDGDLLQRILLSLDQLAGGINMERLTPTKQHGIPQSAIKPK
jgi:hypothetical protein